MEALTGKHCQACEGGMPPLESAAVEKFLSQLNDWQVNSDQTKISKVFKFKGFNKTMGFVNAVAWIANQEVHHPDLEVSYDQCIVHYTTHAINGLSENDFICAAKIDALF